MTWNWELPDWPEFRYDPEGISHLEKEFLLGEGSAFAYLKTIDESGYNRFIVEILSFEGVESAKIEGEILDRESLQSSLRRHFGLHGEHSRGSDRESSMADLLCSVYATYDQPLSHEMTCSWHGMLFKDDSRISDIGRYRTHPEPMQIVSNRYGAKHVFFEAPPSSQVLREMDAYLRWFNSDKATKSILCKAAIAHLYFENIHPFEDGNGRIGRLLSEKVLSQEIGRPVIIAISKRLEKRKREYYAALERCNRTLDVQYWVDFFAEVVIQAQKETMVLLYFIIEKTKLLNALSDQLNARQLKALFKMFDAGPVGFKGGLSAENYITITKASRATATRDLSDLVKMGALIKTGTLRHTRYYLNLKKQ